MRISAAACLAVALVFSVLALSAFAGRTFACEFLSIRQAAEQAVISWLERVIPDNTSSQTKVDSTKYKQDLARTRERLKSIDAEREKLEIRVAELERQRTKQGWRSSIIANTTNIVSAALLTFSAVFAFLAYRFQKKTPRPSKSAASSRSQGLSDRLSSPFDTR